VRSGDAPKVGTEIFLTTTDGVVMRVRYLGTGGIRQMTDKGHPQVPWVWALESAGLYGEGEEFRTGWERLSKGRPRKQNSQ